MSKRTTLQDIADALEITKVTVSRALKEQSGVSETLRKRVIEKADELGYHRSSLRLDQETPTFAFVTPKRYFLKNEHFYTEIYYYLQKIYDYSHTPVSLIVVIPDQEEKGQLPNTLQSGSFSGVFLGGEMNRVFEEALIQLGCPIISIDYCNPEIPGDGLTVDNYDLGYRAARYLQDQGHQNIGFIGSRKISSNVYDRMMGVEKALMEKGLPLKKEWIISNYDIVTGHYETDIAIPAPLPTAFICHCDMAAYYLIRSLNNLGLSVPEDISVMSFDDTELASRTTPGLTAIRIKRRYFAEKAAELMNERLHSPQLERRRIYLDAELIERESVRFLPGDTKD